MFLWIFQWFYVSLFSSICWLVGTNRLSPSGRFWSVCLLSIYMLWISGNVDSAEGGKRNLEGKTWCLLSCWWASIHQFLKFSSFGRNTVKMWLFIQRGDCSEKVPEEELGELWHHEQAFSVLSWDRVNELWQPWWSQVLRNNGLDPFSVSLFRLTLGLAGPPGNAWVQRGPCPKKRAAPRSLPTSLETPMPSVSPPVLSCRTHAFNPSSESHSA